VETRKSASCFRPYKGIGRSQFTCVVGHSEMTQKVCFNLSWQLIRKLTHILWWSVRKKKFTWCLISQPKAHTYC